MRGGAGTGETRGMANLVGIVLLIGLTLFGAMIVVAVGASALGSISDQTSDDVGEDSMREMSGRIASVADSSVDTSSSFSFSDDVASDIQLEADSQVTVAVANGSTTIPTDVGDQESNDDVYTFPNGGSAAQPLGTLVYERSDGSLVAYQGGGLWSFGPGQTRVLEQPQLDYDGTTVDFSLVNVSGSASSSVSSDGEVVAKNDVEKSRASKRDVLEALQGAWTAPAGGFTAVNMTITIQGPYADGWAKYARDGMTADPANVDYDESTQTVRIEFEDLGNSSAGGGGGTGSGSGSSGSGSGGSGGTGSTGPAMSYDASANALTVNQSEATISLHSVEIGEAVEVEVGEDGRSSMDVVFAIDETGSMWDNDPDAERLNQSGNFIDSLNGSLGDRAGFVQFTTRDDMRCDGYSRYYGYYDCHYGVDMSSYDGIANHHLLDSDLDSVEGDLVDWRTGGTNVSRGVEQAISVFEDSSDVGNNRVMIVLTDGENTDSADDDRAVEMARRANQTHGITVYSIGLTEEADDELTEDIAEAGGGEDYFAEDADDLKDKLDQIASDTRSETIQQINRTETTVTAHQSVSELLRVDGSVNVNDPDHFADESASPTVQTISGLTEGDALSFILELRTCDDYETTDVTDTDGGGTVYNHTRCVTPGTQSVIVDNSSTTDHVVIRDGDSVSALSGMATEWWHSDPGALLSSHISGGTFDLADNESVIALQVADPTTGQSGYVLLHVEVDEISGSGTTSTAATGTGASVDPITIGYSEIAVS